MSLTQDIKTVWQDTLSPLFAELASDVLVEELDQANSPVDSLYAEEAAFKQYKPGVSLKARVKIAKDRLVLPGGEAIEIDARMTFRTEELATKNIRLDFSARVSFNNIAYTVVHWEKTSQVGDEFLLTKIYLKL